MVDDSSAFGVKNLWSLVGLGEVCLRPVVCSVELPGSGRSNEQKSVGFVRFLLGVFMFSGFLPAVGPTDHV